MSEILAYVDAILNLTLGFLMIVIMGFLFYLLGLALVTMARNKQPRWDSIAYVLAILVLGLAMWRFFPTIAIKTMRVSLQDARPEVLLLQDEVRQWVPAFEVNLPTPSPILADPVAAPLASTPIMAPVPTVGIVVTDGITVTLPPPPATPYPTYTPWPSPTPLPTATPCLVQVGGNWLACPPTPVLGGG